jgi:hypothetical protein
MSKAGFEKPVTCTFFLSLLSSGSASMIAHG